jgi:hypothetical protein
MQKDLVEFELNMTRHQLKRTRSISIDRITVGNVVEKKQALKKKS